MPKIAEIEPTPNPNAMKLILREPLTWGITRSYDSADEAREDAERLVQEFRDMATGKLDLHMPHHLGRLTVFSGVRDLPTRVKCAILPWHTLQAALNSIEMTSTEADADPMHAPIGNA